MRRGSRPRWCSPAGQRRGRADRSGGGCALGDFGRQRAGVAAGDGLRDPAAPAAQPAADPAARGRGDLGPQGDVTDGAIIAAIVVLSVGLGLVNEYRSAKPQPGRMEPVGLDAARGAVGLDAARRAVESAAFELAVRAQALREVTSHVRPGESARPRSSPRCRLVALSSVAMTSDCGWRPSAATRRAAPP